MYTVKHQMMRSINTTALLQVIYQHGAMSRQLLHQHTGLSWGAISNIVADLLAKGILVETPVEGKHSGRPPTEVDINSRKYLFGGIDINMQGLCCVITNVVGQTLISLHEADIGQTAQAVLDKCSVLLRRALEALKLQPQEISGIGISIQGSIDQSCRISLYSPHLPEWNHVHVCDYFEAQFGVPAMLFHDTNAMLLAERRKTNHRVQHMAFIRLGMGFGMSLMINGQSYSGADGNASEYGHTIIQPDGLRCTCGNRGCLEAYVSGRSLLQQTKAGVEAGQSQIQLTQGDDIGNLARLAQAARAGNEFERSLFRKMGHYFGLAMVNLINALNPELIVVGGDLSHFSDLYLEEANAIIQERAWKQNRICMVQSSLDADGAAIGAAVSVVKYLPSDDVPEEIRHFFENRPQY